MLSCYFVWSFLNVWRKKRYRLSFWVFQVLPVHLYSVLHLETRHLGSRCARRYARLCFTRADNIVRKVECWKWLQVDCGGCEELKAVKTSLWSYYLVGFYCWKLVEVTCLYTSIYIGFFIGIIVRVFEHFWMLNKHWKGMMITFNKRPLIPT